jgi:hypothetical protein
MEIETADSIRDIWRRPQNDLPPDKWFENHLTEGGAALGWAFYAYVGQNSATSQRGKAVKARMAKICNLAMRESSQSRNIERMGWVQTNHTRSVMMRSAKLTRNEQSIERREVLHDAASRLVSSVVVGSGCSRAASGRRQKGAASNAVARATSSIYPYR